MKDITQIDKNFALETSISREGLTFYDAKSTPFRLHGVFWENGCYRRMPEETAKQVSLGVHVLSVHTAGGRVRFITDSPYVAIKTECCAQKSSQAATAGHAGFDMYSEYDGENRYEGTFIPPYDLEDGYESVKDFKRVRKRVITINFPLYASVSKLYIGLKEGSLLEPAPDYKINKPVVFYGSSITQGGCASKPGGSYQSILSRRFDCDYINLGFSGGAKGEDAMIDYMKELEMSAFVMDYDYNAPTPEHLRNTHSKMYQAVRAVHTDIPILMLPRPKYYLEPEDEECSDIIYQTYLSAKEAGDERVYFISGPKLMELTGDNGTVDGCHPTDSGFLSMANAISEVFAEFWKEISE